MKYITIIILVLLLLLLLFISFNLYQKEHFNNNDFYKWKELKDIECNNLKNDIKKINNLLKSCNRNNQQKIKENINDSITCIDATNMDIFNTVERSAWCEPSDKVKYTFNIQSNTINDDDNRNLINNIFKAEYSNNEYEPYRIINDHLFKAEDYLKSE
jgi:hypothetical protein